MWGEEYQKKDKDKYHNYGTIDNYICVWLHDTRVEFNRKTVDHTTVIFIMDFK